MFAEILMRLYGVLAVRTVDSSVGNVSLLHLLSKVFVLLEVIYVYIDILCPYASVLQQTFLTDELWIFQRKTHLFEANKQKNHSKCDTYEEYF